MKFKEYINEFTWSNINNINDLELKKLIKKGELVLCNAKVSDIIKNVNVEELNYVDKNKVNKIKNDKNLDPPLIKPRDNKKELMFIDGRHRTVSMFEMSPNIIIPFYVYKEDLNLVKKILKIKD